MTDRRKPFPYDAVETPDALLLVIEHQGGDDRAALGYLLGPRGLQIDRADGTVLRLIHLHPRLLAQIGKKPLAIVEVAESHHHLYAGTVDDAVEPNVEHHLTGPFYWYIGPETASVDDVASRPFSRLVRQISPQTVAVAPGEYIAGPLLGLCNGRRGIVTLAMGRDWGHPSRGLIIDRTLAHGETAGYPATDDIAECVALAHSHEAPVLIPRERGPGSSQIGMAFKP